MDIIYNNYTCTSCGLDISVSSIENLPPACPRCKCIDWLSEGQKIEIEWMRKWEQRRYELAKELLLRISMSPDSYIVATTSAEITASLAEATVMMADAIIKKLMTTENIFYEKTRTKPK